MGSGRSVALVADHLELDPVGLEGLARELRGGHRVAGGEAAGGVGQQHAPGAVEHVDERAARRRVDPPQRDRGHLGPGRRHGLGERVEVAEAAGAHDQAGLEARARPISQGAHQPPCTAWRTSTRWPSSSAVSSHAPRGTTSPSTATATPRRAAGTPPARDHGARARSPVGELARLAVQRRPSSGVRGARASDSTLAAVGAPSAAASAPATKRAGQKAARPAPGFSPASRAATASAVIGASRTPWRWWPVAQTRPSTSPRPTPARCRASPGAGPRAPRPARARRRPGAPRGRPRAAGTRPRRSPRGRTRAPRSWRRSPPRRRRGTPRSSAACGRSASGQRGRPGAAAQPQDLALDRAHRRARVAGQVRQRSARRAPAARTTSPAATRAPSLQRSTPATRPSRASSARRRPRTSTLAARAPRARRASAATTRARVDLVVVRARAMPPPTRGESPGSSRRHSRPREPLDVEAERALEARGAGGPRSSVVAVGGHHQRAARAM